MKSRSSHFSPGLIRCRLSLRQELNRLFWMGFEAAFLFIIAFALASFILVKCTAPEWLEPQHVQEVQQ